MVHTAWVVLVRLTISIYRNKPIPMNGLTDLPYIKTLNFLNTISTSSYDHFSPNMI